MPRIRRVLAVLFGVLLVGTVASAQGPFSAQIQAAIRALLSGNQTITGTWTFATPPVGAGGLPGYSNCTNGWVLYKSSGDPCKNTFIFQPLPNTVHLTAIADVQPSLVVTGGGAATFYEYFVVANFADGSTTAGGLLYADTSDGPATLDSTHYNQISWTAVTGATTYSIYTDERDGTPSTIGLLGTTALLTFRDNGVVPASKVLYAANTTGSFTGNIYADQLAFHSSAVNGTEAFGEIRGVTALIVPHNSALDLTFTGATSSDASTRAGGFDFNTGGADHGDQDAGDFVITFGNGHGTGRQGGLWLNNFITADPVLAGYLWNNGGLLSFSGTLAPTLGNVIVSNGGSLKTDTTTAHTALFQAYDVDGTAYKTFGTLTNGNTPDFTIAPPSGGTVAVTTNTGLFDISTPTSITSTSANSCGTTSPTLNTGSSNSRGSFNVGATSGTNCTLTFSQAAAHAWICNPTDETSNVLIRAVSATTTTTTFQGVMTAADVIGYNCNAF